MFPLRFAFLAVALTSVSCSDSGSAPAPLPDAELTAEVRGPNEVFLAWRPPLGASSVLLRDGGPITPPLPGASWIDLSVQAGHTYDYAVEVRGDGAAVTARGTTRVRTAETAGWAIRDLYAAGGIGRTSCAVAPEGTLFFTFHDANAGALMLGTLDGDVTAFGEIARGETTGRLADLALDSTGTVHIAYRLSDDMRYTTPAAGGGFEVVTLARLVEPEAIAIAVDDNDRAHVVYRSRMDQSGLRYHEQLAASWTNSSVPALGPTVGAVDVVSLGGGDLAVLYFAGSPSRYMAHLAMRTAGSWSTDPITEVDRAVGALAIDAAGRFHVALLDVQDVLHVEGTPGDWTTESLGGAARGASQVTVGVSAFGDVHLALHGRAQDLVHLVRFEGVWTEEFVDADGNVGEGASIALAPGAPTRIVYHDVSNGMLRIAEDR